MSYYLFDNPGPVPQYANPRRGGGQPSGTIIIHTAECAMDLDGADDSAENCARFIANRSDYGSYHRLVDSDSIIALVPFEAEAWQDTETNGWGIGISAAVSAGRWLEIPAARRDRIYRNMGAAAAEAVLFMSARGVSVPLRRISGGEARARVPGFCAHGDSGLYRSDPGVQFDWALFFQYTQEALGSGAIAPAGTTSPIDEDDLMATPEQRRELIQELLNTNVDQAGGGTTNLRALISEDRPARKDILRVAENVVHKEFTQYGTDGKPNGVTTIANVLGVHDANVVLTRGLVGAPAAVVVESLIAAGIAKEVVDLLSERLAS